MLFVTYKNSPELIFHKKKSKLKKNKINEKLILHNMHVAFFASK